MCVLFLYFRVIFLRISFIENRMSDDAASIKVEALFQLQVLKQLPKQRMEVGGELKIPDTQ